MMREVLSGTLKSGERNFTLINQVKNPIESSKMKSVSVPLWRKLTTRSRWTERVWFHPQN